MRLLVGLNHLELGGCQLNALDFAVSARDHGHQVVVFAAYPEQQGPLAGMVREAGLHLVLLRDPQSGHGTALVRRSIARELSRVVARERIELVHAYEPALILDSFYGPHLRGGVPLVGTIYGNLVPWWMPRHLPLIVGARDIAERAAARRTRAPVVIEPPVNTDTDTPALVDAAEFRRTHGLDSDLVIAVVSRLEPTMKADGIELAIAATELLADPRIQLVIVGDGPSLPTLRDSAARANAALGRPAVVLTGSLADPRPAYAAADIMLGMGGSALRAMAFGKPLVVLGVQGFAKPVRPATIDEFLVGGFFGIGSGDRDPRQLAAWISELADQPGLRSELGSFGHQLVAQRFSLKAASASLEEVYAAAANGVYPAVLRSWEALRVAACRASSEGLPDRAKDLLRPVVRSTRSA